MHIYPINYFLIYLIIFYRKELKTVINKKIALKEKICKTKATIMQSNEQLALTKEDLMSKLLQRADFVARREELDQALELFQKSHGDEFLAYCKNQHSHTNSKYLENDLQILKKLFINLRSS